jgi:MFS family permease
MFNLLPKDPNAYRWIILPICFLLIAITNGLTLGGLPVFDEKIMQSLKEISGEDILVGDLKIKSGITLWSAGIFGIFSGIIADKFGVKKLMVIGLLILSACFWQYGKADSLMDMYIIHAFMGLVLCVSGMIVNVILISRWFSNNRGLAIGILLAGTSVGNGTFPQINTYLLSMVDGDWRQVMTWLSMVPLTLIPLLIILIKDGPQELLDTQSNNEIKEEVKPLTGFTLIQALKNKNFWFLSLMAFCTFYSILAMADHVFLLLRNEEYPPQVSATGVSLIFFGGFVGKFFSGKLAEMIGRKTVLLMGVGIMLIGSILIVLAIFLKDPIFVWTGLALYGTGWGGLYTLIQLLTADLFGLMSLGKIMGVINVLDTLGGGLGPVMTGYLYDLTQSYLVPFSVISCLLVIALISSSLLQIDDKQIEANR